MEADKQTAVERMQSYIEEHLQDTITLSALARYAQYSPWYASRLFKEYTGKNPFDYIRLRRLSSAARDLHASSGKVIDVAFDFVFDSHEGFTRAFARRFGMTPREFRKRKPPVLMFLPENMRDYYKSTAQQMGGNVGSTNHGQTIFVQVIERPARKLVLKRGDKARDYFEYCNEVGCEIWEQLGEVQNALHEPMGLWLPERFRRPGTSTYVQGVEVPLDFSDTLPEGFEIMELPPCLMMVFQGQPYDDEDFREAISSLWEEIGKYRPETHGFAWDDDAGPRFQLEPLGYRGYIEGRPVKRLEM